VPRRLSQLRSESGVRAQMTPSVLPTPTIERVIEFAGARALAKQYEPHLQLGWHAHSYAAFVLVVEGTFEESCGTGTDVRSRGALRVLPAGEPHTNTYAASGARCFLLELPPAVEAAWAMRSTSLLSVAHLAPVSRPATIVAEMYDEFRVRDEMAPLALHGLSLELLAELGRVRHTQHHAPPWLTRTRMRIEGEFREPIDLVALARDAGVHPSHLNRMFRQHYACSPFQFVARLRIAWAKRELATSGRTLAAIATSAGFSDQANFTRRFRQLTGYTPGVYRAFYGAVAAAAR
jgi:AraC family transcriptional regulator